MDKYSAYVVIVYGVTLALLVGYLVWMWWRLRAVSDEAQEAPR
ncbi:heme exporter protein CcmD [Deinococcus navajonensis]|uniref:Heme exporter protein D n=1 Tax=Deinococcus navajonensis TaxID=309884 RepID=A0ABV8XRF3_9DEIO